MTKKRLIIVTGLLAVLIGLGVGTATLIPPGPGVTKWNFDRVHDGMTQAEVELILGKQFGRLYPHYSGIIYADWNRDDGAQACIRFDEDVVTGKDWRDASETLGQKLRRWVRLR